jgi:hypothetical protein
MTPSYYSAPLTGLYSDRQVPDAPREHACDFLDAASLSNALANEGDALVTPGGARYRAIFLGGSSDHMSLATLQRLATLVEGGATLIGRRPTHRLGLVGDTTAFARLADRMWAGDRETTLGKGRVIASGDADATLATIGVAPSFRLSGGEAGGAVDVPFVERVFDGGAAGSWSIAAPRPSRPRPIFAYRVSSPRSGVPKPAGARRSAIVSSVAKRSCR